MSSPTRIQASGARHGGRYWRGLITSLHRTRGPAMELDSGYKEWWFKGRCHAWQPGELLPPHTPYAYMGARSDLHEFGYRRST